MTHPANAPDYSLPTLAQQVRVIAAEVRADYLPLSPEQRWWRPAPGSWSIGEVFDHLVVTDRLYHPRIRAAIERTRAAGLQATAPYRPTFFSRLLLGMVRPDSPKKLPAPKPYRPAADPAHAQRIEDFLAQQDALLALMRDAEGWDLNRKRFGNPVIGLLRQSIGDGLAIVVTHQRRHVLQAKRVRGDPAFPG